MAEESNPAGQSRRFWKPSAFPDAITTCVAVPRAGVEPDLGGLKDRRPHRKSNGAHPLAPQLGPQTRTGRGFPQNPRPARLPLLARQGLPARIAQTAHRAFKVRGRIMAQTRFELGRGIDRTRGDREGREADRRLGQLSAVCISSTVSAAAMVVPRKR